MSKQKVKVLAVARDVQLQRKSDGGAYTATKLTYQDANNKVTDKPFAQSFLENNGVLDQQLAALAQASLPVDVVLEMNKSPGKDGKMYNQITAILPGTTSIAPGEEFVPSTFKPGGSFKRSGSADFRSSKVITRTEALRIATEVSGLGSVDEILAAAARFEKFINEADGPQKTVVTGSAASVAPGATEASSNPFKF